MLLFLIDVFIGTLGTGHTFPGAVTPFGKIQASPDCAHSGWNYCSGYRKGGNIHRISMTHLSGTGACDGYDISYDFKSFLPEKEIAHPGYYEVHNKNGSIKITVDDDCSYIIFDNIEYKLNLKTSYNWDKHTNSNIITNNGYTYGHRSSKGWVNHTVYFNSTIHDNTLITCIDHERIPNVKIRAFDEVHRETSKTWINHLSVINSSSTIINTALYHSLIHPSKYNEKYDTIFSTWDTYRSWNTLMTILFPNKAERWTQSMMRHKYLPIWEIFGSDSYMMGGTHSISMIGEYILKGLIKPEMVWNKINQTLYRPDRYYNQYYNGYISTKDSKICGSMQLEHSYTDHVLKKICDKFNLSLSRPLNPQSYKLIFNGNMFLPRNKDGSFIMSNHNKINNYFEEGSALTYRFSVVHDFKGLIELYQPAPYCSELYPCTQPLYGRFKDELDLWFKTDGICGQYQDMSDCIGQYVQSNEPNHHVIYYYTIIGHPEETCRLLHEAGKFFTDKPDGIPGNDDCGQTSSWLIFAAMGMYPVNPSSGIYILGCPIYEQNLTVKNLHISRSGTGYNPTYFFNDHKLDRLYLTHEEVINGGKFHVELR